MAVGHIVTLGFGTGSFTASIGKIVTLGYGSGAASEITGITQARSRRIQSLGVSPRLAMHARSPRLDGAQVERP